MSGAQLFKPPCQSAALRQGWRGRLERSGARGRGGAAGCLVNYGSSGLSKLDDGRSTEDSLSEHRKRCN
jgi:hypothetical protein